MFWKSISVIAIDCDGFLDATGDIVPPKTAKCCADSIAITDIIPPRMAKCCAEALICRAENGPTSTHFPNGQTTYCDSYESGDVLGGAHSGIRFSVPFHQH